MYKVKSDQAVLIFVHHQIDSTEYTFPL